VEVWEPDAAQSHLQYSVGYSEDTPSQTPTRHEALALATSVEGQVFTQGVPVLQDETVLIPIGMQGRITAVMGLTL
jgi:hypothetical protein